MRLVLFLVVISLLPVISCRAAEEQPIPEGVSSVDLDGDGKDEIIVKAWRENFNAHGFYVLSFYKQTEDGRLAIIPVEEDGTLYNMLQTSHGVDCTTRDVYREGNLLVISQKEATIPICAAGEVTREFYAIKHNRDGIPGTPEWYIAVDGVN